MCLKWNLMYFFDKFIKIVYISTIEDKFIVLYPAKGDNWTNCGNLAILLFIINK